MHSNELFQIRLSVDNQTETPELDWNMYDLLMKGWLRWTLNCDQPIFCFRPDQIWDWERLTSPPKMFIFLWNVYWCKDLISVLLSILYSPLLYHHLQPFWVEMYTPARIVFVSIQFFYFWERQGGQLTHTRVEFGLHHQHWALYGALSSEVGSFFTEAYKCQKFLHISSVLTCWNMNLLSTMFCLYII